MVRILILFTIFLGFSSNSFGADSEQVIINVYCSLKDADFIVLDSDKYIAIEEESHFTMNVEAFMSAFGNCIKEMSEGTSLVKISGAERGESGSSKPIKLRGKDGKTHEVKSEFLSRGVEATKALQKKIENNESIDEVMMTCSESNSKNQSKRQFSFGLAATAIAGYWFSGPIVAEIAAALYDIIFPPEFSLTYLLFHGAAREHTIYNISNYAHVLGPLIGQAAYCGAYGATKVTSWGNETIRKFSDTTYSSLRSIIRSYLDNFFLRYGKRTNTALLKAEAEQEES